jgi:hypothetical protein
MEELMTGQRTAEPPSLRIPDPDHSVAVEVRDALTVIPSRSETKYGITVQMRGTGAHFRIQPVRDPRQPRFWCVSVRQCSADGALDNAGLAWIDRPSTTRAELAATIDAIRDDVGGWLANPARNALCRWLLTADPLPTAAQFAGVAQPSRRRPD